MSEPVLPSEYPVVIDEDRRKAAGDDPRCVGSFPSYHAAIRERDEAISAIGRYVDDIREIENQRDEARKSLSNLWDQVLSESLGLRYDYDKEIFIAEERDQLRERVATLEGLLPFAVGQIEGISPAPLHRAGGSSSCPKCVWLTAVDSALTPNKEKL